MEQKDYVLRIIEQLARAMGRIFGIIAKGEPLQALPEIAKGIELHTGFKEDFLLALPQDELIRFLSHASGPDVARLWSLAELWRAKGDALEAAGDPHHARDIRLRALPLYAEGFRADPELRTPQAVEDVQEMVYRIGPANVPDSIRDVLQSR